MGVSFGEFLLRWLSGINRGCDAVVNRRDLEALVKHDWIMLGLTESLTGISRAAHWSLRRVRRAVMRLSGRLESGAPEVGRVGQLRGQSKARLGNRKHGLE